MLSKKAKGMQETEIGIDHGLTMLNFVHVTQSVSRLGGGLFESVRHLSQSVQLASGGAVTVLGLEDERTGDDIKCWSPLAVRAHRVLGPAKFGYSPGLREDLSRI